MSLEASLDAIEHALELFCCAYTLQYYQQMHKIVIAILLACTILGTVQSQCTSQDDEFLVTFHPHLDAFWLNTDDELKDINFQPAGFLYAMNQRNSKTIFNSMLEALQASPIRKYFVTEVVFFKDWFEYISADQQNVVRGLLKSGQLEISNGGWVQNDEAVCYHDDILDQYTVGMNYLYNNFDLQVKIGWATDSFGHSHSQVALQHLLGIQFQGIERVDDRYIYQRKDGPLLQFYWSAVSDSNGKKYAGVNTHLRHFLHQVNDLRSTATFQYVNDFKRLKPVMTQYYQKNKLFRFLGNDFEQFISAEFSNLETTFKELNGDSKKNCPEYKYGNPTDFLKQMREYYSANSLPIRENDLMTNWDQSHYWSGYFTTNPDLKKKCKDFSRLVGLVRKIFIKGVLRKGQLATLKPILDKAEELLAVLQHHDGITATSKMGVQNLFKSRINDETVALMGLVSQVENVNSKQVCFMHLEDNRCTINSAREQLYFTIIHQGSSRVVRVELVLPSDIFYDVHSVEDQETFCFPTSLVCMIIFDAYLSSGENHFQLNKVTDAVKLAKANLASKEGFKEKGFQFRVSSEGISYESKTDFVKFAFVQSLDPRENGLTMSWNKYGEKTVKYQTKNAGIYIMANSGEISPIPNTINHVSYVVGKKYVKVFVDGSISMFFTITLSKLHSIEFEATFKPPNQQRADYFLQVESNVKAQKAEFYHDMNGYLVSKRTIDARPDYEAKFEADDKINGNTFPACSFIYIKGVAKKFVGFIDRAQAVTLYDGKLLFLIDRLSDDDGKGAGEGYYEMAQNTFRYKFSIQNTNSDIQRLWQKSYDEALIGYFHESRSATASSLQKVNEQADTVPSDYVKYNLMMLNANEYLLRITNLAEYGNFEIKKPQSSVWIIPSLGLQLKYVSIVESFANGVPLNARKSWRVIENELGVPNCAIQDSSIAYVLGPLQIRSFRINVKEQIHLPPLATQAATDIPSPLESATIDDLIILPKKNKRRCF